jgi:outer membrane protein OmpA-like peptidoglycan-associated protein
MKKLGKLIFVFTVLFYSNSILAQDKNNQWQVSFGSSAVDFVNEGENVIANKRANVDAWNYRVGALNSISLSRYSDDHFNYGLKGSFNTITTMGDGSGTSVDQLLTSIDVYTEYNLGDSFSFWNIHPFFEGGTGYSWFGTQKSLTLNGGVGIKIPFDDKVALKINSSYKHAFNDMQNLRPHVQHTIALAFNFGGVDSDGDGIYDQYDDCPDEPGLPAFNGCPDNDGDGIENSKDVCPDTPGLVEFDGCPDSDGDGTQDSKDACVNQPGSIEMNGCPDSDGDGVGDNVDSCVDVAGPVANNGCPWPDTDGDTILDKDDKCPNTPGLVNNNGCPQPTKEIMEELNAVGAKVPFSLNAANLSEKVTRLLGIVQKIMEKYPTTNFTIEGHTDTTGPKAFNQKLSEDRANAVLDFLVTNGVASERLSSVGFGEDKPLNPNNTRKGRESNRRVEFKVVE